MSEKQREYNWTLSDERLATNLANKEKLKNGGKIYEMSTPYDAEFAEALENRGVELVHDRTAFAGKSNNAVYFDPEFSTYYVTKYVLSKKLAGQPDIQGFSRTGDIAPMMMALL